MNNLHNHAMNEFRAAGWVDADGKWVDDMQEAMCAGVLKLLDTFSEEGHTGSTAPYAVNLFKTLAMFEPIVPLTGEDWEWVEVGTGVFQNKRCSHVFKQKDRFDGQAYDIEGKVFREPNGVCYTNSKSFVPITFPYTPKREYVEVKADEQQTD